jgi:biopolymer transport protein ExbD
MNFQRGWRRDDPEINLIPMIDVLLVILIFLMVTTTYARYAELKINLPEAQAGKAEEKPAKIEIAVDASGAYLVNGQPQPGADVPRLSDAMRKAAGDQKEPVVVIIADGRATHQSVIMVMDAARRVGYTRITFTTQSARQTR